MEMWKGRGRVLILASRGPVDVGEEDLQPLPAVDILDAAPTVERRVDMVAGGDEDGFAVDRHLSTALDDIIAYVEGAQLRVGPIVKIDRNSVGYGKSVAVRVDFGGRRV